MKIKVLTILCLVFLSCKNANEKETEQIQIVVDSTELNNTTTEKQNVKIKPDLEFKEISGTIKSHFGIESIEFTKAHKILKESFYPLLDSTKIKGFKHYPEFLVIEFTNLENAENEFEKIKLVAQKILENKKELHGYYNIFHKSGVSYNQIDKWIVSHLLACNMEPKDYEIDKNFTSELEKLGYEVDWIRSFCGWGKMEIK